MRYCLSLSEKQTAPPFGLRGAHPSLKLDWKGSLPCLSITLVLSSSERVRDENFSIQPRLSLSYTLYMLFNRYVQLHFFDRFDCPSTCWFWAFQHQPQFTAAFCITIVMHASMSYSRSEAKILLFCHKIGGALMLNVNFIPLNEFARVNLICLPHSTWYVFHTLRTCWYEKSCMALNCWSFLISKSFLIPFTWHTAAVHSWIVLFLTLCAYHWQWERRGPRYSISLRHLSRGIGSCRIHLFQTVAQKSSISEVTLLHALQNHGRQQ